MLQKKHSFVSPIIPIHNVPFYRHTIIAFTTNYSLGNKSYHFNKNNERNLQRYKVIKSRFSCLKCLEIFLGYWNYFNYILANKSEWKKNEFNNLLNIFSFVCESITVCINLEYICMYIHIFTIVVRHTLTGV